jgi:proline iminopeptidase
LILASLGLVLGCSSRPLETDGYVSGGGGARIFFQVTGSGPDTILVVHGGPGAGITDIRPDLEPLSRNHVVIFYDQRGGGRSELPVDTALLAPRFFVDDLEAVRQHFHLERMSVVAHSFGAIIVAEYLQAHPDRIARVVFLGATGPNRQEAAKFYQHRPPTADTATRRLQLELLRSLMEGTATDPVAACQEHERLSKRQAMAQGEFTGKKGSECNMPEPALRYYFHYTARIGPRAFGDWDFTRSLQSVEAPLLVIDGERDTLGMAMERSWAASVPNGRLLIIPGAGRAAHAERPKLVFAAMDEFFNGRWPEAAIRTR